LPSGADVSRAAEVLKELLALLPGSASLDGARALARVARVHDADVGGAEHALALADACLGSVRVGSGAVECNEVNVERRARTACGERAAKDEDWRSAEHVSHSTFRAGRCVRGAAGDVSIGVRDHVGREIGDAASHRSLNLLGRWFRGNTMFFGVDGRRLR
jgi:hypothetical protein